MGDVCINISVWDYNKQASRCFKYNTSYKGTTPVYFAAQEGRLDAIKFLYTKLRCDLATPSNDGLKPIHAASQCGHTHIVKVSD